MTLALPASAVIKNMSVDKCVDMCTEKVSMSCLSYLQYCVYRPSYIISSFVCHRNSLWQPWLVKNVTVDFLLHSSPCMSVRMRKCVSSTVPEKILRAAETMTSL